MDDIEPDNIENETSYIVYLRELKAKGKAYSAFPELLTMLQRKAARSGLDDDELELLASIIIQCKLGSVKIVSLLKCLTPVYKMPEGIVKSIVSWCLGAIDEIPVTVVNLTMQWIVGLYEYQLVDRKIINMFYPVYFTIMLKKKQIEKHAAQLIYLLTKPDDITRANVLRLIQHHQIYSKPQKHILALLILFKSYNPRLVPEQVVYVNVKSVWKPLPEALRLQFQDAKNRAEVRDNMEQDDFNWNTLERGVKSKTPLLPSVGYFLMGFSTERNENTKTVFDIANIEDLGKLDGTIELPSNALSLLSNTAGFHLLTYADSPFQNRFSYNLYNTLQRAFFFDSGKFPLTEMEKLLHLTVQFSKYVQQGIPVVNLFLNEFLNLRTGDHEPMLLALLEWFLGISVNEIREKLMVHIQNMYYASSLDMKCSIIHMLKMLIVNLFVNEETDDQEIEAPFEGHNSVDKFHDLLPIIIEFVENLIVSGLNVHSYDVLLVSEALSFYEEISLLEELSGKYFITLAPPAVIYGGFITKSVAVMTKLCSLVTRCHTRYSKRKSRNLKLMPKNKMDMIPFYAHDIVTALLHKEPFSNPDSVYFFKKFPKKVLKDLSDCDLDNMLSISNHYAVLPHLYTLRESGLNITSEKDTICVANFYYPEINELLTIFTKPHSKSKSFVKD